MSLADDAGFPLLVADIGGTSVRFGWVERAGATLDCVESFYCADYPSPQAATQDYLRRYHGAAVPARTAIAIASVVDHGPIKLTNSSWVLEPAVYQRDIGSGAIDVFNDFEAIALVLPYLTTADYTCVGAAAPNADYAMAVIGPGTGLGVAGIVPIHSHRGAWQTVCGEGGHATLAGVTDYQHELLRVARRSHAHVSAERLVSGIGLPTLRRAVAEVEGLAFDTELSAEEIGTRGSLRSDPLSEKTVEAFCNLLGCVAGNVALTLGARGGVFIAGGIVPKLGDFFAASGFREHFEAKGRYRDYLRQIATPLITAPNPGLLGLVRNALHTPPSR